MATTKRDATTYDESADEVARLKYEVELRNRALVRFGRHHDGCPTAMTWDVSQCNCGWYGERRKLVGA